VASINYRGSTNFGRYFREALTGRIGGPDIDDVVWAWRWLVDSRIADPDRVVKSGYSYGGYLTLQALGTHPELWVAGVVGAPIADWVISYEDQNDILRGYQLSLFGGPPEDLPEAYAKASPRTYAANYQAPILISQPENDPRTPIRPVQMFVDDLRAHDKTVALQLLRGGHAGSGVEQTIEMMESWLDFAAAVTMGPD
jgi:dipeptidyl aminopeptidase/acylaminoacyl peptidase